MKKLIVFLALSVFMGQKSLAHTKTDTTIVEFVDKALNNKVKVITNNNKTIELPKSLNLNNILKAIGVDSSEREKALVLISKGKNNAQDTLLVLSHDGQKIKIIAKEGIIKRDTLQPNYQPPAEDNVMDKPAPITKVKPNNFFPRSDFGLYLGLNNFLNSSPTSPFSNYGLRTWQSRFIALSFRKNVTLQRGKNMDVAFSYGPEIAWSNFMFENSNHAVFNNSTNQVSFMQNSRNTSKSKLVLPFLNLPIMMNFGFHESKFKLGLGGYVGYRLGGYTKEIYSDNGKNKVKGSFGMQDLIYGLTTELGFKGRMTLFFRYNLSDTFKSNQINAQGLQTFCGGIRI